MQSPKRQFKSNSYLFGKTETGLPILSKETVFLSEKNTLDVLSVTVEVLK